MTRNEAREIIMQILYELDASKQIFSDSAVDIAGSLAADRLAGNHTDRGAMLLKEIILNLEEIDGLINRCGTGWKTSRMPKVDLAIMRLAIGEIIFQEDVPEAVAINEAINLAGKYSTDKSAKFVHGLLGAVTKVI
ncbi:MAG: transcription antitermination factor NusB [Lentihominibacter sp.]|jgi:N utilization substance protein B